DRPRRRSRDVRVRDRLHRRRGGGVRPPAPGDARAGPRLRGAERRRAGRRGARRRGRRRAHLVGDRDPLGRGPRRRRCARAPARRPPSPLRARARARDRAGRHRHPSAVGLPRPADHRDRALPARRGRPALRGVAQQHLLGARARRHPRRRPRHPRLRSAASHPADPARHLGQLALRRRSRLRAPQRSQPDLHQVVSALRRARRLRLLGRVGRLRRPAHPDGLHRGIHAAVVVGATAPLLRHDRGADLRRPDDRAGGRRADAADRRLRPPGRRRGRCRRGAARPAQPADRGEHVAGDPPRPRRAAARSRERLVRGVPGIGGGRPVARVDRRRRRPAGAQRRAAPAPDDRRGRHAGRGLRRLRRRHAIDLRLSGARSHPARGGSRL
ncbi:MAG: Enzymatic protein of unknown function, partial [uncultured Solirubrobacteraceae bacterium]